MSVVQVTSSLLKPPGVKNHILMLADNEPDKTRWVGALNELHKVLKKNKIPDKSVCLKHYIIYIASDVS